MKILLLGGGGREHAFAWKLSQSPLCTELYIAPGNGGTRLHGRNVAIDPMDFEAVGRFVLEKGIEMVIPGPEAPLVAGIADWFEQQEALRHVHLIGPTAEAAKLEGSKAWAKAFMAENGIPTASSRVFAANTREEGLAYIQQHPLPIVLKADGLAAGKGVVICQSHEEAAREFCAMLDGKFGAAGRRVVVEQYLEGTEFSVFAAVDGSHWQILPVAKDYKRVGEGDTGPNTGGMGAVSPVPFVDAHMLLKVEEQIIRPTLAGLADEDILYKGFLFLGLMEVDGDPYVIEYNCRMGDPETEVVFPRLDTDLVALCLAIGTGSLAGIEVKHELLEAATVVLVSGGYPGPYEKGKHIEGWDAVSDCLVFHAGTQLDAEGKLRTNGGRVLALTALAETFPKALEICYRNAERIQFEGKYYRRDIGFDLR